MAMWNVNNLRQRESEWHQTLSPLTCLPLPLDMLERYVSTFPLRHPPLPGQYHLQITLSTDYVSITTIQFAFNMQSKLSFQNSFHCTVLHASFYWSKLFFPPLSGYSFQICTHIPSSAKLCRHNSFKLFP